MSAGTRMVWGPVAARTRTDGGDGYKWIALSNTVLASLIVTIDTTIVLIGLPPSSAASTSTRSPRPTRSTCCG